MFQFASPRKPIRRGRVSISFSFVAFKNPPIRVSKDMTRTQLEYVDLRDPSTRQRYVDDAPTPLEGTPLPEVDTEVSTTLPPPLPRRTRPPRPPAQPRREKRPYVKTTLAQKLGLKTAFEKHGDALSDDQNSTQFGIHLKNTAPADPAAEGRLDSAQGPLQQKEQTPPAPTPREADD